METKPRTNTAGISTMPVMQLCWAAEVRTTPIGQRRLRVTPRAKQVRGEIRYQKNGVPIKNLPPPAPDIEVSPEDLRPTVPTVDALYAPSDCYDMYIASALSMYNECSASNTLALHSELAKGYTDEIRKVVTLAVKAMGGNLSSTPDIESFIQELAALSFVYERCSYSSILRTGIHIFLPL